MLSHAKLHRHSDYDHDNDKRRDMRISLNRSSSKGATMVEFALLSSLFFFMIFATVEFGWFFFVKHTIQYATREGTRLALVGLQLKDKDGNSMSRESSIIKTIRDSATMAIAQDTLQISIYPVGAGYSDPADWQTTVNAGQGGDYMRVRTSYTYKFVTPFIRPLFPKGVAKITASALYRNELF